MPVPRSFTLFAPARPAAAEDFYHGPAQSGAWRYIIYAHDETHARQLGAAETFAPNGHTVGVRSIFAWNGTTKVLASWLTEERAGLHQPYSAS